MQRSTRTTRPQHLQAEHDWQAECARRASCDFLRDNDDLAPARPHVWLVLVWLFVVLAVALLFFSGPAGATTPPKKTLPAGETPGTVPPAVTSVTANGGTATAVTSTTNTVNASPVATSGAQAGAQIGGVTAGNQLAIDMKTAQAPDVIAYPTAPCRIAIGGSAGWLGGAFGFTGSTEDENCTLRETSRQLWNIGQKDAATQILCLNPDARLALQASGVACRIERPAPVAAEKVTP